MPQVHTIIKVFFRLALLFLLLIFLLHPLMVRAEEDIGTAAPYIPKTGTNILKSASTSVDISHTDQGYMMCRYTRTSDKVIVQVKKDGSERTYKHYLKTDGTYEAISFTEGDGLYHVSIWERVTGKQYSKALSIQVKVSLTDPYLPFLYASARVNFTGESACVQKGMELTRGAVTTPEKIDAVYRFITEHIRFDKELAANVSAGYKSDSYRTLSEEKGICLDYASLAAAMLRSQGVPVKVVFGTNPYGEYHAWICVYIDEAGTVGTRTVKAGTWLRLDPTFDATTTQGQTKPWTKGEYIPEFIH